MRIVQITDWHHFQNSINELDLLSEGSPNWTFRGQANAKWQLLPSLTRYLDSEKIEKEKALGIEFGMFRRFAEQAHLFFDNAVLPEQTHGPLVWWMLMQHYACPTRLLDWTNSPYVGAYFSVNQEFGEDGALFAIASSVLDTISTREHGHLRDLLQENESIFEDDAHALFPILGTKHTTRSSAQQGCYTICTNVLGNHGSIIDSSFSSVRNEQYCPIKYVIPRELKKCFLANLAVMNINSASLFPGADGIGKQAHEYLIKRIWAINSGRPK